MPTERKAVKVRDLVPGKLYFFDSRSKACGYFEKFDKGDKKYPTATLFLPKIIGSYQTTRGFVDFGFNEKELDTEQFYTEY